MNLSKHSNVSIHNLELVSSSHRHRYLTSENNLQITRWEASMVRQDLSSGLADLVRIKGKIADLTLKTNEVPNRSRASAGMTSTVMLSPGTDHNAGIPSRAW